MTDVLDGVLDIVDSEERSAPTPTPAETKTPAQPEPKTEDGVAELEEVTAKESEKPVKPEAETEAETEEETDTTAPSKTNTEETETNTETNSETKTETEKPEQAEPVEEVELNLPEEPKFNYPLPEYDDEGYITNMDRAQYEQYLVEKAKHEFRVEAWVSNSENKALDAAEKILPEMSSNQAIRKMVENTRTASILNGKPINSYEAAKLVKDALGITSSKIADAKAEGAQNAKVSITKQKSAAVETQGSTTAKRDNPKTAELSKRLKAGDDEAFAELFEQWDEDGKL